ncbi:NTP pyrophosphatase (non-canonical NTP hydrolase) [Massilia umbonata]|uniref:NTP pyrophosphatase (Non-canonical NTP hydrolase) n=1 Tax=Pseudoduganella umbonata TaxID=864828 RepID=A0A4P8HXF2_9BURK|nr:nucleotide pyrophosphohydrolase [Pseudoduganella umbonata]MBB3223029.1 NTP pyrophosphatase (non-canonical NTP hydrolase) [Pseudoduganella umbonata]QCP13135.1 nucleotide pyrophosphohydrolase [Pseudoduganella umbonata]
MSGSSATPGPASAPGSASEAASSSSSSSSVDTLIELRELTRVFAAERDWQQFHTPKNLAMALSVEVAELVEHFQWLRTGSSEELDERKREGIQHELADVLLYLVQLADATGVDLRAAALEKLRLNGEKYPAAVVKGDARKYDEY